MKRVDQWELVAAVAMHVSMNGTRTFFTSFRIANTLDKLSRIARTLHRLNEDACNLNVPMCSLCADGSRDLPSKVHTPSHCHYARVDSLEDRANQIGGELGLMVETQRDPRGPAVRLWTGQAGRVLGCL